MQVDIPHEVLEEGERSMKVKFGEGTRNMVVRTREADIVIKEAKE